MRTARVQFFIATTVVIAACASAPLSGALNEGSPLRPQITAVDTAHPPAAMWVQIDQPSYASVLLVIPGHSATLVYPPDSTTSNQLNAGSHLLHFAIPEVLARPDTGRRRPRSDSGRVVTRGRPVTPAQPIPSSAAIYLLLVTSAQPLDYSRIIAKTAGVSIPTIETEALNAVAKAVKSTIVAEPRDWSAFYHRIELLPNR